MGDGGARVDRMVGLVRSGDLGSFVREANDFEAADLADVLARLEEPERVAAVRALPPEISSQALAEMPQEATSLRSKKPTPQDSANRRTLYWRTSARFPQNRVTARMPSKSPSSKVLVAARGSVSACM